MEISIHAMKEEIWYPKKLEIIFETKQEYQIFDDMLMFHTSIPDMMVEDNRVKHARNSIETFLLDLRAGLSG